MKVDWTILLLPNNILLSSDLAEEAATGSAILRCGKAI